MADKLDGAQPFRPPKDWAPRLKLTAGSVISDDESADRRVAVVLTEDDYHSVSDPKIRQDPDLHEHNLPARVWWADDKEERTVAGLLAAIQGQEYARLRNATPRPIEDLKIDLTQEEADAFLAAIEEKPWRWLASTLELQTETYGYELPIPSEKKAELAAYIQWNLLAAYQELGEIGVEFSWKPWAIDEPFVNVQRIVEEIVDVQHFMGNILTALGIGDDELAEIYQAKQDLNRRRKASGTYSAKKGGLGEGSDSAG